MNTIKPGDPRYLPVNDSYAESRKLVEALKAAHEEWLEEERQRIKMHEISEAFRNASEYGSIKIYL